MNSSNLKSTLNYMNSSKYSPTKIRKFFKDEKMPLPNLTPKYLLANGFLNKREAYEYFSTIMKQYERKFTVGPNISKISGVIMKWFDIEDIDSMSETSYVKKIIFDIVKKAIGNKKGFISISFKGKLTTEKEVINDAISKPIDNMKIDDNIYEVLKETIEKWKDDYEQFIVDSVKITIIKEPAGGCNKCKKIFKLGRDMKLINHKSTNNNCFFHSLDKHIRLQEGQNVFKNKYYCNNIRKKYGLVNNSKISLSNAILIAKEEYNIHLSIMNTDENDYNKTKPKTNENKVTIYFLNDHYMEVQVLNYKEQKCNKCGQKYLNKHCPKRCLLRQQYQKQQMGKNNERIVKPKKSFIEKENKHKQVIHYDIESYPKGKKKEHTPYIVGYIYFCTKTQEYIYDYISGDRCMERFIDFVETLKDIHFLNAYNGGSFDHYYAVRYILKKRKQTKMLLNNGSIIKFTWWLPKDKKDKKTKSFHLIDLGKHLTGSLSSNLKAINADVQKGDFNHSLASRWEEMNENLKKECLKYLECDVKGLKELYDNFNNTMFNKYQINLSSYITTSQTAFNIWSNVYLGDNWIGLNDKDDEEFCRKSTYGGRTYPNKHVFFSKQYEKVIQGQINFNDINDYMVDLDVVSLYPAAMKKRFPVGNKYKTSDYKNGKMGIYTVDMTSNKKLLNPVIPRRAENGSLKWDLLDIKKGVYTSIDIERALKYGYTLDKVYDGLYWEEDSNIFEEYINDMYKAKQDAKKGTPAYTTAKLYMNALYGKMLQRPIYKKTEIITTANQLYNLCFSGIVHDITSLSDRKLYVEYTPKNEDENNKSANKPTHLGSFILAYSRDIMYQFMEDSNPEHTMEKQFSYTDTDSMQVHSSCLETMTQGGNIGDICDDLGDGTKIIKGFWIQPKLYCLVYIKEDDKTNDKYNLHYHFRGAGLPQNQLDSSLMNTNQCEILVNRFEKMKNLESQFFVRDFRIKKVHLRTMENEKMFRHYHIDQEDLNKDGISKLQKSAGTNYKGRNFISENVSYPHFYETDKINFIN